MTYKVIVDAEKWQQFMDEVARYLQPIMDMLHGMELGKPRRSCGGWRGLDKIRKQAYTGEYDERQQDQADPEGHNSGG